MNEIRQIASAMNEAEWLEPQKPEWVDQWASSPEGQKAEKRRDIRQSAAEAEYRPGSYIDFTKVPGTAAYTLAQKSKSGGEFEQLANAGETQKMKDEFISILKSALGKRYADGELVSKTEPIKPANPDDPESVRKADLLSRIAELQAKLDDPKPKGKEEVTSKSISHWNHVFSTIDDASEMLSLISNYVLSASGQKVFKPSKGTAGLGRKFMSKGEETSKWGAYRPDKTKLDSGGSKQPKQPSIGEPPMEAKLDDLIFRLLSNDLIIIGDLMMEDDEGGPRDYTEMPGNPAHEFRKVYEQFKAKLDEISKNPDKVVTPQEYEATKKIWLNLLRPGSGISKRNVNKALKNIADIESSNLTANERLEKLVFYGTNWLLNSMGEGVIEGVEMTEEDESEVAPQMDEPEVAPQMDEPQMDEPQAEPQMVAPQTSTLGDEIASYMINDPEGIDVEEFGPDAISVWVTLPLTMELTKEDENQIKNLLTSEGSSLVDAVISTIPEGVKPAESTMEWSVEVVPPRMIIFSFRVNPA